MNAIIEFDFDGNNVRTVEKDGEHLFVAKDLCTILEVKNSRQALSHLDDDEKDSVTLNDAIGRARNTPVVNESGMYALVMRSRKPQAKTFRKYVTSYVLPELRKNGIVMTPQKAQELIENPDLIIGLAKEAKKAYAERDHAIATKAQIGDKKTATALQRTGVLSRNLKKSKEENKELNTKNEWLALQVRLENEKSNQRSSRMAFKTNRKSYCAHCDKLIRYGTYAFGHPNNGNGFRGVVHQNCNESYIATKAVEKLKNDK